MAIPGEAADVRNQGPGSARTAQARRQLDARMARDTRREDRVDEVLARYYHAIGRAERIRVAGRRKAARVITAARRKADAITMAAEREAAAPDADARRLMRQLHELVGGKAEVAELCGLTVKAVTSILAAVPARTETNGGGSGDIGAGNGGGTGER